MRTLSYLLCIFAAFLILPACQKEFEDPVFVVVPPASSLDTFRVMIDGVAFPTYGISTTNSSNLINLTASDVLAFQRVSLAVPANVTPGSYPLDYFAKLYFGVYYPDTSSSLISNPGTIKIISNNINTKRIAGTFDFNAQTLNGGATVSFLTNGYFSVKYP